MPVPDTVLITGAAGHLGRAVAQAFAASGARLALMGRTEDSLRRAFGEPDETRLLLAADLLDLGAVQRAVQRLGRVDVLCNLAGGFAMGPAVHETDDEAWDRMMQMNVRSLLNAVRAVVPGMVARGRGRIVNVGAASALQGRAGMGAYIAAKSSVMRLTETMSAELREKGINVNCVLPSIIDTPDNRAAMPSADPSRWVTPEALAEVIAFLASEAARAVHGACLPVAGLS